MKHAWPSLQVLHERAEEATRAYIPTSPQPTRRVYTYAVYTGKRTGVLVPVPWAPGRVHNINHTGGSFALYLADGSAAYQRDLPPGFPGESPSYAIVSDRPLRWEFQPVAGHGETFAVEFLLDNIVAQDADRQCARDAGDAT